MSQKSLVLSGIIIILMIVPNVPGLYNAVNISVDNNKMDGRGSSVVTGSRDLYAIWGPDDFESGDSNWGTSGGWVGLTTSQSHSPSHSETDSAGNYPTSADSQLYMITGVDLSSYSEAHFIFWHRYSFESGWDGGLIEVSTDGGSTWNQVDPTNSQHNYDSQLYNDPSYPNVIGGKYAFTGSQSTWTQVDFDVSSVCGNSDVRFKFRLGSDTYPGSGYDGWYIDDVEIAIPNALPIAHILSINPDIVLRGDTVSFSGNGSDPDGSVISYQWDFDGDGTYDWSDASSGNTTHVYNTIGKYYPKFRTQDNQNAYSSEITYTQGVIVHTRPTCTIDAISPSPAQVGYTVTFNATANDEDGDNIITFRWTSDIDGELYNGSSPTFSTSSLSIGLHNISLTVEDQYHVWSVPVQTQLLVQSAPTASIVSITPNTITQGQNVTLVGTGTDPEGDAIVNYEWYALSSGIPMLIASGPTANNVTTDALLPGENTIYFRVTESHGFKSSFVSGTVTVNPKAGAPTCSITSPSDGAVVEVGTQVNFQGSDSGGVVEHRWGHINSKIESDYGMLNNQSASFSTSSLLVGVHTIYYQVKDSSGLWSSPASISLDIDTRPEIVYYKPTQTSITINEGEKFTFNITAMDADYDSLTYNWYVDNTSYPSQTPMFTFDTTGNYNSQGTYQIRVTVSDGVNRLSASHTWTLIVKNVNQPPTLDDYNPHSASVTINEGDSVTFDVTVSDIDEQFGDVITYQWTFNTQDLPGETDSSYTYTAGYDDEGRYDVGVIITSGSDEITHTWVLRVNNKNRNPVISSYYPVSLSLSLNVDSIQKFSINATDPDVSDNSRLTYFWYLDETQLEISDTEYILVCNDTLVGDHTLNFTVADPNGGLSSVEWDISVAPVNHAPQILTRAPNPEETQQVNEGESITFEVTAYDPDDDLDHNGNIDDGYPAGEEDHGERNNLTFTWTVNNKEYFSGKGNTGGTWTMVTDFLGDLSAENSPLTVKVDISDGENTVYVEWQVNVVNVNRKPIIVITSPDEGHREFNVTDHIKFDASESYDPDNETITFAWYINDKKVSSSASYLKSALSPGDYTIKLEVKDSEGGSNVTQFQIRILSEEKADIDVIPVDMDPAPVAGKTFNVKIKLENNGKEAANGLVVSIMNNGNSVASETVDLPGGSQKTVSFNVTASMGASYTVMVSKDGNVMNSFDLPLTVQKSKVTVAKNSSWDFTTVMVVLTIVLMIIILGSVFAFIKILDIRERKEEEKRKEEERRRYAQVSEEDAQAALNAQIEEASMEATSPEQGIVEDGQFVFSDKVYSVEDTGDIYSPETGVSGVPAELNEEPPSVDYYEEPMSEVAPADEITSEEDIFGDNEEDADEVDSLFDDDNEDSTEKQDTYDELDELFS